jgi:hypothetical protein
MKRHALAAQTNETFKKREGEIELETTGWTTAFWTNECYDVMDFLCLLNPSCSFGYWNWKRWRHSASERTVQALYDYSYGLLRLPLFEILVHWAGLALGLGIFSQKWIYGFWISGGWLEHWERVGWGGRACMDDEYAWGAARK